MWNILVQKWNEKDELSLLFETRDFDCGGDKKVCRLESDTFRK
jgi:hypothetical protein